MRSSPRWLIGVAIALLGLTAGVLFWNRAFPTAALQFAITSAQAEAKSRELLQSMKLDVAGYTAATQFGEDSTEKNFVEKEYGIHLLETKVREGLNLWYWTSRFFKPLQEEEFSVSFDPQGRFVGVTHRIEETAARPLLTREQARVVAEAFLKQFVTHHPLDQLKLVEDSSRVRPHRTDYYFTWERASLRLGDAPYQLHVTVLGDAVGHYNENVKVPEAWRRKFNTQRSLNSLFDRFATFAAVPIFLGTFVFFVLYAKRHQLRWRTAVPARWLILFALVSIASSLNDIPDYLSSYRTTDKWGSFVFSLIGSSALGVIGSVLSMYLLSLVADALYRHYLPEKLTLSRAMGRNSLFQPETVTGLGVGIVLACFGIGYVCTFYVVANYFGAWSPLDIDYSKILGGPIPWISGAQVGMSAAWYEEFQFRIIGIFVYWALLRRHRFRWIGIVAAGMTWAFLHSNYPQMPGYLRGCELTVEGILWGAVMVRYGVVATLTGHYLYDCWLSSLVVFQSSDPLNQFGALAVSVWPIALWLIGRHYIRTGQKPPEEPEEEELTIPDAEHVPTPPWNFHPISLLVRQRWLALMTAVLVWIAIDKIGYPPNAMDDFGEIALSREQIIHAADKELRERGQDPASFHRLVSLNSNYTSDDYLLEHGTPEEIAYLFESEWPDMRWSVRYFRFMQKEEFSLSLDKNGKLIEWNHSVPRESKGAELEKAAALQLAQNYLTDTYGVDFKNEKLVEDDLTQQEHRRDYSFTWERKDWDWGESKLRTDITIQGNEPIGFSRYVKVPDEWYRDEEKKTGGWKSAVLDQISGWSSLVLGIVMLGAFIILLRRGLIPWRVGFVLGLIPTVLALAEKLNAWPWFYSGYATTKPVLHFVLQKIGGDAVSLFYTWGSNGVKFSVAFGLAAWAFGWKLEFLRWPKSDWATLRRSANDYFPVLFMSLALLSVTGFFTDWLHYYTDDKPNLWIDHPSVNTAVPWLASLINALQSGINSVVQYGITASIAVIVYRRWPRFVWAALLLYPFYSASSSDTAQEYIRAVALSEFHWILTAFLVWKLWRFDVSLIFLAAALPSLVASADSFYTKGGAAYADQAWPLTLAAGVLIILGWWLRPSPQRDAGPTNASPQVNVS